MNTLSKSTIAKLKNFAAIQPNLVYKGDGKLKTIAEANNIMAVADLEEDIDAVFGIYALDEFLAALNLIPNPVLEFDENQVTIKGGNAKIEYKFANPAILTSPQKDITMPTPDAVIAITADDLNNLRRAASTFGYNAISISHTGGTSTLEITVEDLQNPTVGNTYTIVKEDWEGTDTFDFKFLIKNLMLIEGDYTVSLSQKGISQWEGSEATYWIAIEATSTYNA